MRDQSRGFGLAVDAFENGKVEAAQEPHDGHPKRPKQSEPAELAHQAGVDFGENGGAGGAHGHIEAAVALGHQRIVVGAGNLIRTHALDEAGSGIAPGFHHFPGKRLGAHPLVHIGLAGQVNPLVVRDKDHPAARQLRFSKAVPERIEVQRGKDDPRNGTAGTGGRERKAEIDARFAIVFPGHIFPDGKLPVFLQAEDKRAVGDAQGAVALERQAAGDEGSVWLGHADVQVRRGLLELLRKERAGGWPLHLGNGLVGSQGKQHFPGVSQDLLDRLRIELG